MKQGEVFILTLRGDEKLKLPDVDWVTSIYRKKDNCIVMKKSDFVRRGENEYRLQLSDTQNWELGTWHIETLFLLPSSKRIADMKTFRVEESVSKGLI